MNSEELNMLLNQRQFKQNCLPTWPPALLLEPKEAGRKWSKFPPKQIHAWLQLPWCGKLSPSSTECEVLWLTMTREREHFLIFRFFIFLLISKASFYNKKAAKAVLDSTQDLFPLASAFGAGDPILEWGWGNGPRWISGSPELTALMQIQQLATRQLWKLENLHVRWRERLLGKIVLFHCCHPVIT